MNDTTATLISAELAQAQLDLLFDYYDVDLATDLLADGEDPDDRATRAGESMKKKLLTAIQKGRLEIAEGDDGLVVSQHLRRPIPGVPNPLVYGEVTGRAKTVMSKFKKDDAHGRIYAFLGALSGEGASAIMRLKGVDMGLAEVLGAIFLMV